MARRLPIGEIKPADNDELAEIYIHQAPEGNEGRGPGYVEDENYEQFLIRAGEELIRLLNPCVSPD